MSARNRADAGLAKWRREVAQARRDGRALADLIEAGVVKRPK